MSLSTISNLIIDLLSENKSVTLPNIGCFVLEENSSEFQFSGKIISPPEKKILFCSLEFVDDGVLVAAYAKKMNISAEEAKGALSASISKIKEQLHSAGKVELANLGTIILGAGDSLYFHASASCRLCGSFPFESISVTPVERESVEAQSENVQSEELEITEREEEGSSAQSSDTTIDEMASSNKDDESKFEEGAVMVESLDKLEVLKDELDEKAEDILVQTQDSQEESIGKVRAAAAAAEEEEAEEEEEEEAEEEEEEEEEEESLESQDGQSIKDGQSAIDVQESNDTKDVEANNLASNIETPDEVQSTDSQSTDSQSQSQNKPQNESQNKPQNELQNKLQANELQTNGLQTKEPHTTTTKKLLIALLIIFVLIIILLLMAYLFREELKPMLERIFYSQDELNILKRASEL